jgi:hypothetical protein
MRFLFERGWSAPPPAEFSFGHNSIWIEIKLIYNVLKNNDFNTFEGNDVNEVLRFVSSREALEY